jgi:serine/threonine protein kinase
MTQPTTREAAAGAGIPAGTVREPDRNSEGWNRPLLRLPAGIEDRYSVEGELPTRGNEADLLVARDGRSGDRVVIKLYRAGIEPKPEIMRLMAALDPHFVIRQLGHGSSEGRAFEIMEWAAEGSLTDFLKSRNGRPAPVELRAIIEQLAAALGYLHGLTPPIVHRDLKPDNILLRSRDPFDLVLADFSFASLIKEGSRVGTTRHRTIRYAAPETAAGDVSEAADWWSLGMIVAEAAAGRHPFAELTDDAIARHLVNRRPIPLEAVTEPHLELLCRGLLAYEQEERWGSSEVGRWLAGDPTLRPPRETHVPDAQESRADRPYRIGGQECWTAAELAAGLIAHWDEAVKRAGRRTDLERWLLNDLHDQDTYHRFLDLNDGERFRHLDADARLSLLLKHLDPTLPLIVAGHELTPERLLDLAGRAQRDPATWPSLLQRETIGLAAEESGTPWLKPICKDWDSAIAEAESIDRDLQGLAVGLAALDPVDAFDILILILDGDARELKTALLAKAVQDRTIRACPWIDRLLPVTGLRAGGLWLLEARLEDMRRAGAAVIRKRWSRIGKCLAALGAFLGVLMLASPLPGMLKSLRTGLPGLFDPSSRRAESPVILSASPSQGEMERAARSFVRQYYGHWSEDDADALVGYFSDAMTEKVEFYGHSVPIRDILAETKRFVQRWPERRYTVRPGSLRTECRPQARRCVLRGQVDWDCRSPARHSHSVGLAGFSLRLVLDASGALRADKIDGATLSRSIRSY